MADKAKTKEEVSEEIKFKGRYSEAIGRRKTAVASVRVYKKGTGLIIINDSKIDDYFDARLAMIAKQPLKLSSQIKDINVSIKVTGGGKKGQADAVRHALAKILTEGEEGLRPSFKAKGWLTRDARKKERKKPGLKKARRAPQWSKR